MIAAVILCVSLAAMLQFFISYCRSLIAASARQPLSAETQDVTGIPNRVAARSKDFLRVTQLLQLCPERPNDRGGIRAVQIYFRCCSRLLDIRSVRQISRRPGWSYSARWWQDL